MEQKNVSFRIRRQYFDAIVRGEKTEELRRFCEFWRKRLLVNRPEIAVFVCGKDVHKRKITRFSIGPPEYFLGRELSEQGRKDIPTKDCIVTHLGVSMDIIEFYNQAKKDVIQKGYKYEIESVECRRFADITPLSFFDAYVYVVLNAGMKNQIAEKIFYRFREEGIKAVNHLGKRKAISIAQNEFSEWFEELQELPDLKKINFLEWLPWIGPITKYHLARNLGIDCAKPDRHLTRIAERFGYSDVQKMCKELSDATGDRIGTVDVVLWRHANLN